MYPKLHVSPEQHAYWPHTHSLTHCTATAYRSDCLSVLLVLSVYWMHSGLASTGLQHFCLLSEMQTCFHASQQSSTGNSNVSCHTLKQMIN